MTVRVRWLILVLLVSVPCAAEYRTAEVESLRITMDSDWATRTAPGYVPVRFDITNLGEPRVIEIVGEGMRYDMRMRTGGPNQFRIRQELRMARGDRVRLTIPVPVAADNENFHFRIEEDGKTLLRFNYAGTQSALPALTAAALIVADPGTPFGKLAAAWPRPYSGATSYVVGMVGSVSTSRSGTRVPPPLDVVLEPSRLPASWLGYTSLRAVVIGRDEWARLEDAQKGALLTWTACGGDLILADFDAAALTGGGHRTHELPADGTPRAYFFGRIHRRTSEWIAASGLAAALGDAAKVQDADWGLPANRWSRWSVITARGFRLPIPGVARVPARAYLAILIVFSVLIGPANYWLLWRKRRQVLFVLTAPVISALFIVLLAGYVLAGEGLHVTARAESVTVLDQSRSQAVTRATVSLYAAGMTPGGGLSFPRDTAVYAIGPDGAGGRNDQTLDLTESQRFASGVIQARAPTNLEVIAFRAARERVSVSAAPGGMSVVNGLGAPIQRLALRSGGQVYVLTAPLAAGGAASLKTGAPDPAAFVPADLPRSPRFTHLVANLPEGAYIAVLDRSPFWSPGVDGVVERGSFHFVIGWVNGQP